MHKQVGNQHSKSLLRYTLLLANSTNVIALVFVLVNHKHFGEAFLRPSPAAPGTCPSALLARPLAAGGESVRWWNVDARQYITLITWPAITARRRHRRGRSRAKTQSWTAS